MRAPLILLLVAACSTPDAPGRPAAGVAPKAAAEAAPAPAPEAAKPAAKPAEPAPTVSPETAARMAGHMRDGVKIKEAVIAGELADVRAPARRLNEQLAADDLPGPWRPYALPAKQAAEAAVDARDLDAAASAAAGLARACGECHTKVADGPRFPPPGAPPTTTEHDPKSQMSRHQWAADHMWLALVSRTDDTWTAAAAALADAPLSIKDITANVELPEEVLRLGDRVHELGQRARTTADWDARASIYGEYLASCATCHRGGC